MKWKIDYYDPYNLWGRIGSTVEKYTTFSSIPSVPNATFQFLFSRVEIEFSFKEFHFKSKTTVSHSKSFHTLLVPHQVSKSGIYESDREVDLRSEANVKVLESPNSSHSLADFNWMENQAMGKYNPTQCLTLPLSCLWIKSESLTIFMTQQKYWVQEWIHYHEKRGTEWLIVMVIEIRDQSSSEKTQKKIFEKIKLELISLLKFKRIKRDFFFRVFITSQTLLPKNTQFIQESWEDFFGSLKLLVSIAIETLHIRLQKELHTKKKVFSEISSCFKNSLEQTKGDDFSSTTDIQKLKDSFANLLVAFEKMVSFYISCGKWTECPRLFPLVSPTNYGLLTVNICEYLFSHKGADISQDFFPCLSKILDEATSQPGFLQTVTYFDFSVYLFSREFNVLLNLNQIGNCGRLCLQFIRSITRELRCVWFKERAILKKNSLDAAFPYYIVWILTSIFNLACGILNNSPYELQNLIFPLDQSTQDPFICLNHSISTPVAFHKMSDIIILRMVTSLFIFALIQWRLLFLYRITSKWCPLGKCPRQEESFCDSLFRSSTSSFPLHDIRVSYFWTSLETPLTAAHFDFLLCEYIRHLTFALKYIRTSFLLSLSSSQWILLKWYQQGILVRHSSQNGITFLNSQIKLYKNILTNTLKVLQSQMWANIGLTFLGILHKYESLLNHKMSETLLCFYLSHRLVDAFPLSSTPCEDSVQAFQGYSTSDNKFYNPNTKFTRELLCFFSYQFRVNITQCSSLVTLFLYGRHTDSVYFQRFLRLLGRSSQARSLSCPEFDDAKMLSSKTASTNSNDWHFAASHTATPPVVLREHLSDSDVLRSCQKKRSLSNGIPTHCLQQRPQLTYVKMFPCICIHLAISSCEKCVTRRPQAAAVGEFAKTNLRENIEIKASNWYDNAALPYFTFLSTVRPPVFPSITLFDEFYVHTNLLYCSTVGLESGNSFHEIKEFEASSGNSSLKNEVKTVSSPTSRYLIKSPSDENDQISSSEALDVEPSQELSRSSNPKEGKSDAPQRFNQFKKITHISINKLRSKKWGINGKRFDITSNNAETLEDIISDENNKQQMSRLTLKASACERNRHSPSLQSSELKSQLSTTSTNLLISRFAAYRNIYSTSREAMCVSNLNDFISRTPQCALTPATSPENRFTQFIGDPSSQYNNTQYIIEQITNERSHNSKFLYPRLSFDDTIQLDDPFIISLTFFSSLPDVLPLDLIIIKGERFSTNEDDNEPVNEQGEKIHSRLIQNSQDSQDLYCQLFFTGRTGSSFIFFLVLRPKNKILLCPGHSTLLLNSRLFFVGICCFTDVYFTKQHYVFTYQLGTLPSFPVLYHLFMTQFTNSDQPLCNKVFEKKDLLHSNSPYVTIQKFIKASSIGSAVSSKSSQERISGSLLDSLTKIHCLIIQPPFAISWFEIKIKNYYPMHNNPYSIMPYVLNFLEIQINIARNTNQVSTVQFSLSQNNLTSSELRLEILWNICSLVTENESCSPTDWVPLKFSHDKLGNCWLFLPSFQKACRILVPVIPIFNSGEHCLLLCNRTGCFCRNNSAKHTVLHDRTSTSSASISPSKSAACNSVETENDVIQTSYADQTCVVSSHNLLTQTHLPIISSVDTNFENECLGLLQSIHTSTSLQRQKNANIFYIKYQENKKDSPGLLFKAIETASNLLSSSSNASEPTPHISQKTLELKPTDGSEIVLQPLIRFRLCKTAIAYNLNNYMNPNSSKALDTPLKLRKKSPLFSTTREHKAAETYENSQTSSVYPLLEVFIPRQPYRKSSSIDSLEFSRTSLLSSDYSPDCTSQWWRASLPKLTLKVYSAVMSSFSYFEDRETIFTHHNIMVNRESPSSNSESFPFDCLTQPCLSLESIILSTANSHENTSIVFYTQPSGESNSGIYHVDTLEPSWSLKLNTPLYTGQTYRLLTKVEKGRRFDSMATLTFQMRILKNDISFMDASVLKTIKKLLTYAKPHFNSILKRLGLLYVLCDFEPGNAPLTYFTNFTLCFQLLPVISLTGEKLIVETSLNSLSTIVNSPILLQFDLNNTSLKLLNVRLSFIESSLTESGQPLWDIRHPCNSHLVIQPNSSQKKIISFTPLVSGNLTLPHIVFSLNDNENIPILQHWKTPFQVTVFPSTPTFTEMTRKCSLH